MQTRGERGGPFFFARRSGPLELFQLLTHCRPHTHTQKKKPKATDDEKAEEQKQAPEDPADDEEIDFSKKARHDLERLVFFAALGSPLRMQAPTWAPPRRAARVGAWVGACPAEEEEEAQGRR